MSEKKISYTNRTFEEYKESLKSYIKEYYPEIANDFNDASIGSWLIDLVAAVSDNLSFHIDRVYNETNINSAQEKSSIYAIARTNGVKIPGPKGAMTEVTFSCNLPVYSNYANSSSTTGAPNWFFAPLIKKGTKLSSGEHVFEVMNDIDFKEQFDENGVSNREVKPLLNANGIIVSYRVTKTVTVVAGESKVYKQVLRDENIKPFMEVIIPDRNIMEVESIIFKKGDDYVNLPASNEFAMNKEYISAEESMYGVETYRFFEVDSLLEQYRWGDDISENENNNQYTNLPTKVEYSYFDEETNTNIPVASIVKGQWLPLENKFITEFTDKGYLKIIFGPGESYGHNVDISNATDFTKAQISRMVKNNSLGKLPPKGMGGEWTMYVKYRSGGGSSSNIAAGTLNNISFLDAEFGKCILTNEDRKISNAVRNSLTVTNNIPSVSGKDAPTVDEIKNMIKYNNAAQDRCVTLKDYENRILKMPSRYGAPFKLGVTEENNKIMIYMVGLDYKGYLTSVLPVQLINNVINYLSMYRTINDFVEIKSARILNLSFGVDIFVDKNYNAGDVVKNVISTVKNYMDVNKRQIGEDIFVGDIQKEISKVDGVLNLIDLRVYNEYGPKYSNVKTTQETVALNTVYSGEAIYDETAEFEKAEIDLNASDYVLLSDSDSIFELKYPETDIEVRVKLR